MTDPQALAPHVEEITRALQGRASADQVRQQLERFIQHGVPLHQAKRDLVMMLGGSRGSGGPVRRKVGAITANDQAVDIVAKVVTVNSKDITARGEPRTIQYGLLGDESGVISYTVWSDVRLETGKVYEVSNAYITVWQGNPQINIGDHAQVEVSDEVVTPPPAPVRPSVPRSIKDLAAGQGNVAISGRVIRVEAKTIEIQGEPRQIFEGELADETGRVLFTAWHDFELAQGMAISVENGYVRAFRGIPNLNISETSNVVVLEDDKLPQASDLVSDKPYTAEELESSGGALGVEYTGVVLEIRPGSGLIFRCSECRRVLQRSECRVHGKVQGEADLRIKAVIDDGTGAITAFINRTTTEELLGRTLEECQTIAREAMDSEIVAEELGKALIGRRLVVRGNASSDDYGVSFMADNAEHAPVVDVTAAAQKVLERLQEVPV